MTLVSAIVAVALSGAAPAVAQTGPTVTVFGNTSAAGFFDNTRMTEPLKLEQAVALRNEAMQLQAADGGTLSPVHLAYIRTRAALIRSGQRVPPAEQPTTPR